MESTTPRVSKAEREVVISAIRHFHPSMAVLGRDHFVGTEDDCVFWEAQIGALLVARHQTAEAEAKSKRKEDERRGFPAWQTFKVANEMKKDLDFFRSELDRVRKEAEEKAVERDAEREAKRKAKADAEAAAAIATRDAASA